MAPSRISDRDAFYTKDAVARACVLKMMEHVFADAAIVLLDPSAGDGAFAKAFPTTGYRRCVACDIVGGDEACPLIQKADFLKSTRSSLGISPDECIVVCTNPPFGP